MVNLGTTTTRPLLLDELLALAPWWCLNDQTTALNDIMVPNMDMCKRETRLRVDHITFPIIYNIIAIKMIHYDAFLEYGILSNVIRNASEYTYEPSFMFILRLCDRS